jgi:hypothetical protein
VTFDHDTDSDSDLDGTTARRAGGVLGKRKADDSRIDEPGPSSASQAAALVDSPPRLQSVAPPTDDVLGELAQHLDASNWPSSPEPSTWRPVWDETDTSPRQP